MRGADGGTKDDLCFLTLLDRPPLRWVQASAGSELLDTAGHPSTAERGTSCLLDPVGVGHGLFQNCFNVCRVFSSDSVVPIC
jgi:hypothetical protein